MPYLISIDPGTKKCGMASFLDGKLKEARTISPDRLFEMYQLSYNMPLHKRPILVIEDQYISKDKLKYQQAIIKLAHKAGAIAEHFEQRGHRVVWASAWGKQGWIAGMLSNGGKIPNREQAKKLSLQIAKATWPSFNFKEDHVSDAALIGQWFLDNWRLEGGG